MSRFITVYRLSFTGVNRGHTGTVRTGLKATENSDFDEAFYEEVLKFKQDLEKQTDSSQTINNDDLLNCPISVDEISKACLNSKNSKSPPGNR